MMSLPRGCSLSVSSSTRAGTSAADAAGEVPSGYPALRAAQEARYKDLHAHPERGIGGTGVVGALASGDGPTVPRAELDALPIAEDTGVDYASTVTVTEADGRQVPVPDVALSQHLLPGIAGTVGTCPGPFMSAEDGIAITVHGRGGHGALPQRLQTIVAREVTPRAIPRS